MTTEPHETKSTSSAAYVLFAVASLFLYYEFFLRVSPSVMVNELMYAFSVDALSLGTLSAFYSYSFAPMQLPVGMLMDRFGVRRLLTFASCICAAGCFAFSFSQDLSFAELGRFFMGIGSSFAFVGMVYAASHWFEEQKRAVLVGIGNSVGMLGAASGEGPLSILVGHVGWRETMLILGGVGAVIALICFFTLGKSVKFVKPVEDNTESLSASFNGFQHVCMNFRGWFNSLGALLFYLPTGTFAALWAVPFLQTVHGLSKDFAAFSVSVFFFGTIVGGPFFGLVSDWFGKRKPVLYLSAIPAGLIMIPLILIPFLPIWAIYLIFFLLGFFSAAQLLNFSLAVELNDIREKGSSIALTNFVVAVGGSIMQPMVGGLLDLSAGVRAISNSVPHYSVQDYQLAMLVFPLAFLLAALCFIPVHERPLQNKDL